MTCMSAESPISFRSAIVAPRSVRRFVGRRRSGLTRTELCHRAAPCYEAIIQRARGNMRLPAAYARRCRRQRCTVHLLHGLHSLPLFSSLAAS